VPPAPVPGPPTEVVATGHDTTIGVSWGAPASGPAVDSYVAFAWDAAGAYAGHAYACATCRSATITGLVNGRRYDITVYAHAAGGWGGAGSSSALVAADPSAPTDVKAVPGNGSATVTWRGTATAAMAVDGYAVLIYDGGGYTGNFAWVCSTCTSATVAGLVNGASYYGLVFPHNPNGWGANAASPVVVAGTPGLPGNIIASRGNGTASASWTPAPNSGSAVDSYIVMAWDASGYTGRSVVVCSSCSNGTISGLTNGHAYVLVVVAHNALGWGAAAVASPVVPGA